jgi:hypothetical protein
LLLAAAAAAGELRLAEPLPAATERPASVGGELRLEPLQAPATERARGGDFALHAPEGEGGACDCLQTLFADGFESGDLSAWSAASP